MVMLKFLVMIAILIWAAKRSVKRDPTESLPFLFQWRRAIVPAIFLVAALFIFPAIGQVGPGERGVVLEFGKVTSRILGEGIYIVTPLANTVEIMDVQVQKHSSPAGGASADIQSVTTEVTVNYSLDPEGVAYVYQKLRRDYEDRIVTPAIAATGKSVVAKFTAEQLVTKRQEVMDLLEQALTERLAEHRIRVDAVALTDFEFSPEFDKAIEEKVTAAQKALTAENDLKRVKFEAEQRVASARGEAEAIRIQAESISQQGGEAYVQMKWVEAWKAGGSQVPQIMTGEGAGFLLNVGPKGS